MKELWASVKAKLVSSQNRGKLGRKNLIVSHPYLLASLVVCLIAGMAAFAFSYRKYAMMIENKFGGGWIRTNSSVYAMPRQLLKGDRLSRQELIARLQRAGYSEDPNNKIGFYQKTSDGVAITTGPQSYFAPHTAVVEISGDRVERIFSRTANRITNHYWLEPELITNLFDAEREKRRPVTYSELPKHLVDALIAVEDKRFFKHTGLDILRVAKAVYVDLKEGRKEQGASTLTMQLARSFWLEQDKNFNRKIAEVFLTMELERRFTKNQIIELYANEIYLGRRGSFSIHGFGEAARAYFAKDVRELTLPESAMLVGIIQRPSYYNPFRYPERVKDRRNLALLLMRNNGYLTDEQYKSATNTPLNLSRGETESSEAPFFVDLVNDSLQERFQDWDFATNSYRVYSTLDLDLQQAAVEAVQEGMTQLDQQLRKMRGKKKTGQFPQVALVALDPDTGEVRALVGGRSYANSQLNHALAKRQPGSSFKPFVYATAINQSLNTRGNGEVITAASVFEDEPTAFTFNNKVYEPANFHDEYHGAVTVRQALAKSMNIPTIKVAEQIGYERVAELVRSSGIRSPIMGTPSLALGSYEVTPVELAESYTVFANKGIHVKRSFVTSIRDRTNRLVYTHQPQGNVVLDQRAAFIMTNLMEEVINSGTAAGARSRGFMIPAAGKTGTSRDGWFAGYTSKLLAVVWIGYDDNAEFEMEAAHSALPVWVNFMKRAYRLRQYTNAKAFEAPKGVIRVDIDPESGLLTGPACPTSFPEFFIAGTQPTETCDHDQLLRNSSGDGEVPSEKTTTQDQPKKNVFKSVLGIFH